MHQTSELTHSQSTHRRVTQYTTLLLQQVGQCTRIRVSKRYTDTLLIYLRVNKGTMYRSKRREPGAQSAERQASALARAQLFPSTGEGALLEAVN